MTKRFLLCAAALLVASACSSDATAPQLSSASDAAHAADTFAHMADSVSRAGGDPDAGSTFAAISGVVRAGGRVAPITLTIDGTAASFVGTVVVNELTQNVVCVRAPCPPMSHVTRTLIAWDKDNPKRLVQLTSQSDDEPIAAILYPTLLASYVPMASLIYLDGAGGTFFGTSGSQKFAETNTKASCPAPTATDGGKDSIAIGIARPNVGVCTLTDAAVGFSAKTEPSTFIVANNTASGTHNIAMASQSVPGSHTVFTFAACDTMCGGTPNGPPKVPPPPVVSRPSSELPAQLTATVDSVVTLTLTMKNPSASPVDVTFPTGQKYDFIVTDSLAGKEAWRWSAGRGFTQTLETRTIPGNGSLSFSERWSPPAKGLYLAHGVLVSTSHRAEAYASVILH